MATKKDTFENRFAEMLKILNISQQDVSDKIGISKSLISRYANGKVCPKVENIGAIAKAYHINPVWLIGYNVPMFEKDNNLINEINEYLEKLNNNELEKVLGFIKLMFKK